MNKGIKRTRVWRLKLEKFNTKRQLHKSEGNKSQGKVTRAWGTLHHSWSSPSTDRDLPRASLGELPLGIPKSK